jgi:branched-subunit amino acid ABC-type transport system permease component
VPDLVQLAQSVANGIVFGAILALCAIGLTLVYGILNLSNFAHGDTLTLGAYMTFLFGTTLWLGAHVSWWGLGVGLALAAIMALDAFVTRKLRRLERGVVLAFAGVLAAQASFVLLRDPSPAATTDPVLVLAALLAIAATVVFYVLLEFALWRPLRRRGATVLSLVIASLGLSIVMRGALQLWFGGDQVSLQRGTVASSAFAGVLLSRSDVATVVIAALLILGVHLLLAYTRIGKAMRALADNRDLARVCGIDVDRTVVYVWVLAAALVAVAGVLLCLKQNNSLTIGMGFGVLIPIFASVLLGGLGSPYGAMVGGLVVGLAMRLGPAKYDLAWAFLVLIAVLLIRPQGILGRKA